MKRVPKATSGDSEIGSADVLDVEGGLRGQASFYGRGFHGRKTATGEIFDSQNFTAASNHFPLGTMVAVRRLDNDRCAIVKVNDRMHSRHRRRVIDVSHGVAEYLGMLRTGVVMVRVARLPDGQNREAGACREAFEVEKPQPEKIDGIHGQPEISPDSGKLPIY